LAGLDWRRPPRIRAREVQGLDQVQAPIAVHPTRAAPGERGLSRRAVPGDIDSARVTRRRPGEDVGVQGWRWELLRRRPAVALAGRHGVIKEGVPGDRVGTGSAGRLLPHGKEIARAIDCQRREIATVYGRRVAEDDRVNTVGVATEGCG